MTTSTVDVSVLVCTRNRAEMLSGAISSVMVSIDKAREAGVTAELVIVDNGSSDGTSDLLADLARGEPRLRSVVEERPGLGGARNRALREALGTVLLFTDDDIRVPDSWVIKMTTPILGRQAHAVAGGIRMAADLERPWMTPELAATYFAHNPVPPKINPGLIGANMAVEAALAREVGYDERLGTPEYPGAEDVLFYVQLVEAGHRVIGIQGAVVEHHFDPSRLEADRLEKIAEGYGRCDAYYFHHWLHTELSAQWLRVAAHDVKFLVRQIGSRGNRYNEAVLRARRERAFHREMLRLRTEPRRYARRGARLPEVA